MYLINDEGILCVTNIFMEQSSQHELAPAFWAHSILLTEHPPY